MRPHFRVDKRRRKDHRLIMPATVDSLALDALSLPADQRVALAHRLLVSVEPEPGADAAWDTEIARRIAQFDAGEARTVPATEVFDRLRKIAPGR